MKSTKMRRALVWSLPILIVGVMLSYFIVARSVQVFQDKWILFLPSLPLVFIWIWVLLNIDLPKGDSIDGTVSELVRESRLLAKSSLDRGNISYGIMCLFFSIFTFVMLLNSDGDYEGLLCLPGLYLPSAIIMLILSLSSLTAGRSIIKNIKIEGGEIDIASKKTAQRGTLLAILALSFHIIPVLLFPW